MFVIANLFLKQVPTLSFTRYNMINITLIPKLLLTLQCYKASRSYYIIGIWYVICAKIDKYVFFAKSKN